MHVLQGALGLQTHTLHPSTIQTQRSPHQHSLNPSQGSSCSPEPISVLGDNSLHQPPLFDNTHVPA